MSLKKAIKYGKEHRKEYRGAKSVDPSCRNHKGCDWCEGNRTYHNRKQIEKTNEQLKELEDVTKKSLIEQLEMMVDDDIKTQETIIRLSEENKKLKELCDTYEEEHNATFKMWARGIKERDELQDRIDNALKLLDSYKLGKYDYALTPAGLLDFEDILRGKDK